MGVITISRGSYGKEKNIDGLKDIKVHVVLFDSGD